MFAASVNCYIILSVVRVKVISIWRLQHRDGILPLVHIIYLNARTHTLRVTGRALLPIGHHATQAKKLKKLKCFVDTFLCFLLRTADLVSESASEFMIWVFTYSKVNKFNLGTFFL